MIMLVVLIVLGILAFAAVGFVLYIGTIYNGLVVVKNNIAKAWANIDVLLKQRHDEIPKLISACEAYMKYEKGALDGVVALRNTAASAATVAQKAQAEGALSAGLAKIFALSENYPDLKANASFQQLQKRISDLESQVADRREFYNDTVNNYNIRIQSFPDAFVASFMGLTAHEMFQVEGSDRADVAVTIAVP